MERYYAIFSINELNQIDFNCVDETSYDTVRKSKDGQKVIVKWYGNTPECVLSLLTLEGIYTYEHIRNLIQTPNWNDEDVL